MIFDTPAVALETMTRDELMERVRMLEHQRSTWMRTIQNAHVRNQRLVEVARDAGKLAQTGLVALAMETRRLSNITAAALHEMQTVIEEVEDDKE